MPNTYTPEQIEQACFHVGAFERTGIIPREARNPPYKDAHGQDWALENEALIILAALEATEKERDDGEKMFQALKAALLKSIAYAAKLEKAGDALRDIHRPLNSILYRPTACENWDAARKEKP